MGTWLNCGDLMIDDGLNVPDYILHGNMDGISSAMTCSPKKFSKYVYRYHTLKVFQVGSCLTILTRKNLYFTEFSTKIHQNERLGASDVFHMFTQSIKFL